MATLAVGYLADPAYEEKAGSPVVEVALRDRIVTKECVSRPTGSGLCRDVAQVRIGEECPDQSRAFLEPPQGAGGLGFQVLLAGDAGLADPVATPGTLGVSAWLGYSYLRVLYRSSCLVYGGGWAVPGMMAAR